MTVPKRFGILRFLAGLYKVIAWIVLVLFVLLGIGLAVFAVTGGLSQDTLTSLAPGLAILGDSPLAGIGLGIALLLLGLVYFVVVYALGEMISMQLAVEENTRLTAALLLRMHQDSQPEARAGYSSGYPSEPFES